MYHDNTSRNIVVFNNKTIQFTTLVEKLDLLFSKTKSHIVLHCTDLDYQTSAYAQLRGHKVIQHGVDWNNGGWKQRNLNMLKQADALLIIDNNKHVEANKPNHIPFRRIVA